MAKIMVSACLLGCKVRYNGSDLPVDNSHLSQLIEAHQVITFCPEVAAGLPTPRPAAEISVGNGEDVLQGRSKVLSQDQQDFTDAFVKGAKLAQKLCQQHDIQVAVLAEGSPSCGSQQIYDGTFSGTKKSGQGVVASLLTDNGIKVYNQHSISEAISLIEKGNSN
ncbi:DUF523 domain-containing protein [Vibrio sonorensis]|uniref:DUF523 domain-containing protein n=1 Tax=Vibrio sonorensis TaxID=1004316 RepID=UPI0008D9BC9A|nr:DUF523 domain-containing protein [Vibrio sonorensis]